MEGVLIVRYKVNVEHEDSFVIWKAKMDSIVRTFKGFKTSIDLYAQTPDDYHYVFLRFDSKENAERWMHSEYRKTMLEDSNGMWMSEKEEVVHDWETFWFSKLRRTKKWKQWIVTLMAVYPLTLAIPVLVNKFSLIVPLYFFEGIINAILISGFMTFLMMPLMIKLFNKWLFS